MHFTPHSQVQAETLGAAVKRGPAQETTSTLYLVPGVNPKKLVLSALGPRMLVAARALSWYTVTWQLLRPPGPWTQDTWNWVGASLVTFTNVGAEGAAE